MRKYFLKKPKNRKCTEGSDGKLSLGVLFMVTADKEVLIFLDL